MVKKMIAYALVSMMFLGTLFVSAQTLGFSGGVSGHLWWGTVWAKWYRANGVNNRVEVYAKGQTTVTDRASDNRNASATAERKPSGNKAYWSNY